MSAPGIYDDKQQRRCVKSCRRQWRGARRFSTARSSGKAVARGKNLSLREMSCCWQLAPGIKVSEKDKVYFVHFGHREKLKQDFINRPQRSNEKLLHS
ncbi:hypothetical protein J6590_023861 [Homalodisca vitripennis]|nr:hypothetical protein J6590_023861 [Homalodisca vitripennis]